MPIFVLIYILIFFLAGRDQNKTLHKYLFSRHLMPIQSIEKYMFDQQSMRQNLKITSIKLQLRKHFIT